MIGSDDAVRSHDAVPAPTTFNRVPQVIALFWVLTVLVVPVGETATHVVADTIPGGATATLFLAAAVLAVVLAAQMSAGRYRPPLFWLTVGLVSVVAASVTVMAEASGVPPLVSTLLLTLGLAVVLATWRSREGTMSLTTITTLPREAWFWSALFSSFALGTAAGDLLAARTELGQWSTALLCSCLAGVVVVMRYRLRCNAVCFWTACVLTRPSGTSWGEALSRARAGGGLGLGPTWTSVGLLLVVVLVVAHLTQYRSDETPLVVPVRDRDVERWDS